MKKALIVLLILAVAGGLFAQSFSGSVKTGAYFTFDGDIPVKAYNDPFWRHDGIRAELNFENGGDDWGVKIGTNAGVNGDVYGFDVGDLKGWVRFADIFKLSAGKGVDDAWYTGNLDSWDPMNGDGLTNASLQIEPLDGLNFGFLFRYPNNYSSANKLMNAVQETGFAAKYSSSLFTLYASLQLTSEETNADKTDATARFTLQVPVLGLFDVGVAGHFGNLFTNGESKWLEEKISGNVAGLGWYVQGHEDLGDSLTARIWAGVDYGIPINDKAKATVGADGGGKYANDFGGIWWDVWANLSYDFNGNVSTAVKFGIDGEIDPSKITPYLWWTIGYSF